MSIPIVSQKMIFTSDQVCEVVAAATELDLKPHILCQWRNYILSLSDQRRKNNVELPYNACDVFEICFVSEMMRMGYTICTAVNFARMGRDYGPGYVRWDVPGQVLLFPGIFESENDGEGRAKQFVVCHRSDVSRIFSEDIKAHLSARAWIVINLSDMRQRFSKAVWTLSS